MTIAQRVAIEQAIARGELPTDFAADHGLPLLDVLCVAQRMDRLTWPRPFGHGTYRGYQRHRRGGSKPCPPCLDARNAWRPDRHLRAREQSAA